MIALTFDDGPDPVWTPRVLDALAAAGAAATFFPLAPRMRAHPGLVARMRAEGHLVGLHGWGHLRHRRSTRRAVAADTRRALGAFAVAPGWWRLPWGEAAPWTAALARRHGLRVVGWTHDTHDWRGVDPATMLRGATAALGDAEITVLAHDALGPGATRAGCAGTVALIEPLVAAARAAGHAPVRVCDLARPPG